MVRIIEHHYMTSAVNQQIKLIIFLITGKPLVLSLSSLNSRDIENEPHHVKTGFLHMGKQRR